MLTVAALQMVSSESLDENLERASILISDAAENGARLMLLPENCFMFSASRFYEIASNETEILKIRSFLAEKSQAYRCYLVAGSVPEISDEKGKVFSTSLVYSPEGKCICSYNKIHLFDVFVEDSIGSYRESDSISPGEQVQSFDCFGHKVGLSICYDLRFPEMYRALSQSGCEILLVPAAFTAVTGEKHWEILLRARAIENQCFVMAANQGGEHKGKSGRVRKTWGYSMVIDANGMVLNALDKGEGVCLATLDFELQKKIRDAMPVLKHRSL